MDHLSVYVGLLLYWSNKISTVTNQVSRFSQPLTGTTPHAIAFYPFTIEYTLQHKQGCKFYLYIDSNRVVQPQIDLGLGGASGIALNPVNNKMYVTNFSLNTVAISKWTQTQ